MRQIPTHQDLAKCKRKVPPDGGYGWIIVIAYAIANLIVIPTTTSFGLIFKDKFAEMNVPAADLTLIININSAFAMSLGFINGPLLRAYGYRKISVIGSLFFAVGMILTSTANSIFDFIITYGLITAVGYGLTNTSFPLALNSYFHTNRNKAAGIAMTLTGIGPVIYPPMIHYLLKVYDVSGCTLIIGALALNMLVAAVLLQPIQWHLVDVPSKEEELFKINKNESFMIDIRRGPRTRLPTVTTFQSIGKFSESSFLRKTGSQFGLSNDALGHNDLDGISERTGFNIDHDIESQSIYGLEQITHLQPTGSIPNQETIARNFSRRTLCHDSFAIRNNLEEINKMQGLSCSQQNFGSTQSQPQPAKRWFESGSIESIHLGSSTDIFKEPPAYSNKRRRSSIFSPFRRQSLFMQTIRKNLFASNSRNRIDDPKTLDVPVQSMQSIHSVQDKHENTQEEAQLPFLPIEPLPDEDEKPGYCSSIGKCIVEYFDLDLLKDKIYLNMMIGMSIAIFAEQNFAFLTPLILNDLDYSTGEIASILSMIALTDIVSRFCSPFVADYFRLSVRMTYLISLIALIMTRMTILFASNYMEMLIIAGIMGFAKGVRSVYITLVIPSYIPIDRLASASGIQMFTNGMIMISMGPVLGLIKDFTGSYSSCILVLNLATFITVTMYATEMTYTHFISKNKCDDKTDENTEHPT